MGLLNPSVPPERQETLFAPAFWSVDQLSPGHDLAKHNALSSAATTRVLVHTAYGWPINGATDSL